MQRLTGTIQNYEWGDREFIAGLQSRPASGEPEAELWFGAHPKAPSTLDDGRLLDAAIAVDPVGMLGAEANDRFGELPFLIKILAAARPLSIQCHPSGEQARVGFDRENALGIPVDSPTRTYRDPNHKPELICALTPFEAKCGFRDLSATQTLFDQLPGSGLAEMRSRLAGPGDAPEVLAGTLAWLLRLDSDQSSRLASSAVAAAADAPRGGPFDSALEWTATLAAAHRGDISVVVALLLNHLSLRPGQAVFLEAGNLHAYLRGAGIELMANSDNVVRGGLTSKLIDVEELLTVVDCSPIEPPVQTVEAATHRYESPVTEFSLTRLVIGDGTPLGVNGPEMGLVTEGRLQFTRGTDMVEVGPGQAVWIPASDGTYSAAGEGILFRATVGHP